MRKALEKITDFIAQTRFERVARGVLQTAPIVPRDDGVILFSMMGTRVLLPYLVAIKSVHAELGMGRVVILEFESLEQVEAFYNSPEYQEAKKHREGAAEFQMMAVEGA